MKPQLCLVGLVCALGFMAQVQAAHPVKHNLPCESCHQRANQKPTMETCLTCHSQDQIVKAAEHLNFTAKTKDPKTKAMKSHVARVNPHDSYHFDRTESCLDCHREHQPSQNACQTCHDTDAWKMTLPR